MTQGNRFRIAPKGPFSLEASSGFLSVWPGAAGNVSVQDGHLHFAFCVEGGREPVGICLTQSGTTVGGRYWGAADRAAVRDQVARIFSLDVDGSGFAALGRRDPVVGRLQARFPGLRPVCFWSPYEAAAWSLIGHRIRMPQAAAAKRRIAERLGAVVDVEGERLTAFPAPQTLARARRHEGLAPRKVDNLKALARAALGGRLDADRLRSLPRDEAIEDLMGLPGIGAFYAELILVRGAGIADYFPDQERRLHAAMRRAYELPEDTPVARLAEIARAWKPYRTWVALLFRTASEGRRGDRGRT